MEKLPEYYMLYGAKPQESGAEEISEVERLMNEFAAHEEGENVFLQRYKEIAAKTESPVVKFLLRMIISDEEKHHAATQSIVTTLKGDLTWTQPKGALHEVAVPEKEKAEILKLTDEFIRLERQGIKDYKQLMKASEGYYHGLFVLLLQSMVRDSEKHVEILEFLKNRLKSQ